MAYLFHIVAGFIAILCGTTSEPVDRDGAHVFETAQVTLYPHSRFLDLYTYDWLLACLLVWVVA